MTTILINIRFLCNIRASTAVLRGEEMALLPVLENAYLVIEDGFISAYGKMVSFPERLRHEQNILDIQGGSVLPAWCDSHTHIVFAGSREEEFVDKIRGLSYEEIAAKGGGILHSANLLNKTSEEELFLQAWERLNEVRRFGTGAIEIKSGYGLTVEGELKMLRVIKKLKEKSALSIKSTFLGAHTFPLEYRHNHQGYLELIKKEMLPVIAAEKLADNIDVFCERGFFSPEESEEVCRAGMAIGLRPKIHANQMHLSGGTQLGVKLGALSVDHLETMDESAIEALAHSDT
ncbi:MAG: imidazolonepropionase, partial [Chitinophagaceae bacterium]